MRRWKAHGGEIASLSFSRDGRFLASVTGSGKDVFIWDATAGELVRKLKPEKDEDHTHPKIKAASVAFAPDADLLLVGRKSWVELWESKVWAMSADVLTAHEAGTAYELVVGAGSDPLVASGHSGRFFVFETREGRLRNVNRWGASHNAQLAFSPDGSKLALHTIEDLQVWDPLKSLKLCEHTHPKANYTGPVRYSPDGSRIAFASTKTIESHPASLDDPKDVIRYVGHKNKVWVLRYTPDGRSLISASSDGTARVWDADSGAEKRCFEFDVGKMLAADVSPDGTIAAVGCVTGEIIVWDLDD